MKEKVRALLSGGLGGEAFRYIIVGGLTTLINFGVFALMTKILDIGVTVSNVTSISISILFAYITNKLIVFRRRCDTWAELALECVKFIGSRLVTMAVEVGCVMLFVDVFGQDELIGKAEAVVIVVILNYVISKLIVFATK
jgi:putative flippase GtrA